MVSFLALGVPTVTWGGLLFEFVSPKISEPEHWRTGAVLPDRRVASLLRAACLLGHGIRRKQHSPCSQRKEDAASSHPSLARQCSMGVRGEPLSCLVTYARGPEGGSCRAPGSDFCAVPGRPRALASCLPAAPFLEFLPGWFSFSTSASLRIGCLSRVWPGVRCLWFPCLLAPTLSRTPVGTQAGGCELFFV